MIYIFSDIHLRTETEPWEILFLDTLQACLNDPRTTQVVLLGDILDICVGHRYSWHKVYKKFFDIIRCTTIPILYVEGNHDFHLKKLFKSAHIQCIEHSVETGWGSKRVFLSHGDWIHTQDTPYLILRSLFRSWMARFFMRIVPSSLGIRIMRTLSRYSRTKNISHLSHHPHLRQVFSEFAQQKWQEGFDCIALGHNHMFEHQESSSGTYINCGFWPRDLTYFQVMPNPWQVTRCNGKLQTHHYTALTKTHTGTRDLSRQQQ